ncbi:MAG TPA: cobalamin-binding protein [Candidatus Omnitrophica bacterium]|nr:cobalamin-binding protein [Candidatus Omnitrophota bacterium]
MRKILFPLILACLLIFPGLALAAEGHGLRIVSLTPATTEILFALGLDEEIVGVSSFCNYPAAAAKKEKVGTFSQANIEKILSLRPDIIFCTGLEQAPMVTELRQLKLKVCVSDPNNLEELYTSILEIGRLTNKEANAQRLIKAMQASIEDVTSRLKLKPDAARPKVYVEFWHDPIMSAGQGSFIDELISLAGGINISHDMPRAYSFFSPEQVLKQDPDIIILAYMTGNNPASLLKGRLGWDKIKAVKNNRVYNDINPDIILRPGPRLTEGLEEIYKRLYP